MLARLLRGRSFNADSTPSGVSCSTAKEAILRCGSALRIEHVDPDLHCSPTGRKRTRVAHRRQRIGPALRPHRRCMDALLECELVALVESRSELFGYGPGLRGREP